MRRTKVKEDKVIIITMILNLIVAILKLVSGIIFSFSTLIADSIQSFMDFITDIAKGNDMKMVEYVKRLIKEGK